MLIIKEKIVKHGAESRAAILRGCDLLADAVKVTLGPKGRNVVIGRRAFGMTPMVTKDGVTVANVVSPTDPCEQIGADLIRAAAQKTVDNAGDGTTTSVVLAQAMLHAGFKALEDGASPIAIKRGMDRACGAIISAVRASSCIVSDADLLNVARISSNGEETLAAIVAKAIQSVGKDGVITVEESRTLETHLEIVSGMQLNSGFLSPYFVTNPNTMKCELEAPLVCLWEGKLSSAKSLVPLIKIVIAQNRPLILIAGDYDNEAVAMLANVRVKQGVQVCAVTTGAFGDRRRALLGDIAAITGANPFSEDMGAKIDNIATVDLGEARKVVVSQDKTLVLSPSESEALSSRVGLLRAQIERATPEEKLYLQARLSGLVGGVAIIKVGAATEVEMKEKKDRAEDAMYAVIAAAEEGVVEGGGMALMSAAKCLYSRTDPGELIVSGACLEPFAQIVRNAGREVIPYSELDKGLGYDASTDTFKDLRVAGIIDPAKVVIEALKNAVSVAGMILTTEAMVAEVLIDDGR